MKKPQFIGYKLRRLPFAGIITTQTTEGSSASMQEKTGSTQKMMRIICIWNGWQADLPYLGMQLYLLLPYFPVLVHEILKKH